MQLLLGGVDRTTIALWLGHENMHSTQAYVHANLAMKQAIMDKASPPHVSTKRFKPGDRLLAFLQSL